jgi:light-regulated signal transduction histidine kinase (bacteriophytochrome)
VKKLNSEYIDTNQKLIATNEDLQKKIGRLERKINREKVARKEAERIMETKSLELYNVNIKLIKVNQSLEDTVQLRTKELSDNLKHIEIANKELMDIAYVVSHDVRGSVRQIGGLASIIDEEYKIGNLTKEELSDYMSEIKNRTFKMYHLLDGIREYISIGRKFHDTTEVDLQYKIATIINKLNVPNGFHINIKNKLPIIDINPDRCFQIFSHIIQNAIEYHPNPSQGVINIEVKYSENHFEVNISDNGAGIAPRYHDKIFKLFQLLHKNGKGKGIGLPIVKKMLEPIRGKISVESEEGQGATFKVILPNELLNKK